MHSKIIYVSVCHFSHGFACVTQHIIVVKKLAQPYSLREYMAIKMAENINKVKTDSWDANIAIITNVYTIAILQVSISLKPFLQTPIVP